MDSQYGGKISEKANAKGNALDTWSRQTTLQSTTGLLFTNSRLQNSVCLIKVLPKQFGRKYSSQDLQVKNTENVKPGVDRKEVSLKEYTEFDYNEAKDLVETKQIELVRLAEQHGLHDSKVYDRQLLLLRSLLFRQYAAWIILKKPGSQTPGIDKQSVDPEEKEEMFLPLVEFLREMTYHPNKYRPAAIKRV